MAWVVAKGVELFDDDLRQSYPDILKKNQKDKNKISKSSIAVGSNLPINITKQKAKKQKTLAYKVRHIKKKTELKTIIRKLQKRDQECKNNVSVDEIFNDHHKKLAQVDTLEEHSAKNKKKKFPFSKRDHENLENWLSIQEVNTVIRD